MRKVLYISNIEVPYRTEYFNQLSKKVDLIVLYERAKSSNRNEKWVSRVKPKYKIMYLKGIKMLNEYTLDLGVIKYIFSRRYDYIIFGCYNSPTQLIAMALMKIFKKKYILNLDGEYFFSGSGIKKRIKRFLIKGAYKYLVAGYYPKKNLKKIVDTDRIYTYRFSSLTNKELEDNAKKINKNKNNKVIVIGQFFNYKGLDLALECAKLDSTIKYKFIGSGKRSNLLQEKINSMNLKNVEVIPFLEKDKLFEEYQNCKCMLLPSRKECWGLVINEAASFGCPIVASNGSGAAVELVEDKWIFDSGNFKQMYKILKGFHNTEYDKERIIRKNKSYSIENSVEDTLKMINDIK